MSPSRVCHAQRFQPRSAGSSVCVTALCVAGSVRGSARCVRGGLCRRCAAARCSAPAAKAAPAKGVTAAQALHMDQTVTFITVEMPTVVARKHQQPAQNVFSSSNRRLFEITSTEQHTVAARDVGPAELPAVPTAFPASRA